jgi:hypothetical protein
MTSGALDRVGLAAVEWKLDGARIRPIASGAGEIHEKADITERVPEIAARSSPPVPLCSTAKRRAPAGRPAAALPGDDEPLRPAPGRGDAARGAPAPAFFFDCLHATVKT